MSHPLGVRLSHSGFISRSGTSLLISRIRVLSRKITECQRLRIFSAMHQIWSTCSPECH